MSDIITIDGTDRSGVINFGSVSKSDIINQGVDTLSFSISYLPEISGERADGFRPVKNSEVIMTTDGVKTFGGYIIGVTGRRGVGAVEYQVKCRDYTFGLERMRVVEGYEDMTVAEIIEDILTTYATDFTFENVDCPLVVEKINFDRVTVSDAIQKLSTMTGYSWYVDYDKDIHFFEKNTERAPFDIEDEDPVTGLTDGNYIPDTLEISDDFSQIRNRVFIKGGEIEGTSRTEYFDCDGTKKQFKLANKFAKKPTVTLAAVAQTVGIDNLDNEDDYDCFWDYGNTYIRFKDTNIPASGANALVVAGIPLYTLVVQVEEPESMAEYGIWEYAKTDKTIKSRDAAVNMAKAELQAYQSGLIEGRFQTYTTGLRSGQLIHIKSTLMGVDEDFVIQRVNYNATPPVSWSVTLATLRSVGLIEFLIGMLKTGEQLLEDGMETVLEKTAFPQEEITMGDEVFINQNNTDISEEVECSDAVTVQEIDYAVEFVLGPTIPDGVHRQFILDGSPLS